MKFDIWGFLKNLLRKFNFHENQTRLNGTLHEDQCTFFISLLFLLRMRNVFTTVVEKIETHFVFSNPPRKFCCLWDNVENIAEPGRPQMIIWDMCISCWITKATDTCSEYVILIAFHCSNGCTNVPECYIIHTLLTFSPHPPCLHHQQRKLTLVDMHCYAEKIWCPLKSSPKNMQSNMWPFKL